MSRQLPAAELAARLMAGEAAVFPTDTLPALAAAPAHAHQLWRLKQRPEGKPVILMGADGEALWRWLGLEPRTEWLALAERHWPGALTLVVPASSDQLRLLNPGGGSLGLRVPNCAMALDLLRCSGPLATTSANRSGEPPCLTAAEAAGRFPSLPQLAPQPWPKPSGLASTVVQLLPQGGWEVLRQGAVQP